MLFICQKQENTNGFLKGRFADIGEAEIKKLLEEKDKSKQSDF